MDYLTQKQNQLFGKELPERYGMQGKRVVVIGGGDTAMDCLRTAIRDGAASVACLYRRDEANMPGSRKEFHNAVEEGVEFCFNVAPKQIRVEADGLLCIDVVTTQLGERDADGRRSIEIMPNTEHCVAADVAILALGFEVGATPGLDELGVATDKWGQLKIDPLSGATSHAKIYAGGDCFRGADLAVTAAVDGRKAALAIMKQLLS